MVAQLSLHCISQMQRLMMSEAAVKLELFPKQRIALDTPATEVLYGGAAGGGKSHLMRVAAIKWCTEISGSKW